MSMLYRARSNGLALQEERIRLDIKKNLSMSNAKKH